ncbi:hypothetical protein HMPREF9151_00500 [Hoylesella saccharolytica F0055]|uniref:Uncharacterized protein n=1 Tax=Hoylesella saccharolytica F0055 TaxID=1127699 RepID=L1NIB7_9BACT|nr:hypothetical protein HMPREF9151_00500 [Hoylesella saccharolytica F0055]
MVTVLAKIQETYPKSQRIACSGADAWKKRGNYEDLIKGIVKVKGCALHLFTFQ